MNVTATPAHVAPAILLAALLSAAETVDASLVVFTDRNNWETSIGNFATETFAATNLGDLDPGVNFYNFFTATISANDSGFTAIVEPGAVNGSRELRARISTDFPNDPSSIDVQFLASVLGIGADFVGTTDGALLTMTVAGETIQFDQHLSGSGDGFLGVISDTPFNVLTLATESSTLSGEAFALDDVSFGPNVIPEPTTFLVWSPLGLSAGVISYRRHSRA